MNPDTETTLDRFSRAVDMLGGQRAAARYLGTNERQIRFLLAGERTLHAGFLRDIAAALVTHAAACRVLESDLFKDAMRTDERDPRGQSRGAGAGEPTPPDGPSPQVAKR